ncbi:MAG: hypothetical protein PVI23_04535 [Maricaulaceae bacterium]|jgi:hypothetical protein
MKRVIGGLFGLIALAVYAAAASELGVTFLEQDLRAQYLPESPYVEAALYWLAQTPIVWGESPEFWRTPLMGAALGAGVVGGFFLVFGARVAAVFLWLAFLLLGGVFIGHDVVMAKAYETEPPLMLMLGAGALAVSFVFALIGQAATNREDDYDVGPPLSDAYAAPAAAAPVAAAPAPEPAPAPAPRPRPAPPPPPEPEPEPVMTSEPAEEGSDRPIEELEVADAEVVDPDDHADDDYDEDDFDEDDDAEDLEDDAEDESDEDEDEEDLEDDDEDEDEYDDEEGDDEDEYEEEDDEERT